MGHGDGWTTDGERHLAVTLSLQLQLANVTTLRDVERVECLYLPVLR